MTTLFRPLTIHRLSPGEREVRGCEHVRPPLDHLARGPQGFEEWKEEFRKLLKQDEHAVLYHSLILNCHDLSSMPPKGKTLRELRYPTIGHWFCSTRWFHFRFRFPFPKAYPRFVHFCHLGRVASPCYLQYFVPTYLTYLLPTSTCTSQPTHQPTNHRLAYPVPTLPACPTNAPHRTSGQPPQPALT